MAPNRPGGDPKMAKTTKDANKPQFQGGIEVSSEEVIGKGKKIDLRDDPGLDAEKYLAARLHDTTQYAKMREDLDKFIDDHLVEKVDYGYTSTHKTGLMTLKKPGAEKIDAMFGVEPVILPDIKTWEMLGSEEGRVCYVCYLMTSQRKARAIELICSTAGEYGVLICSMLALAEGRGCGNISEKKNSTDNTIVKVTMKRSQVDSTIRLGGLSDRFTQDLEDGVIQPEGLENLAIEAGEKTLEAIDEDSEASDANDSQEGTLDSFLDLDDDN